MTKLIGWGALVGAVLLIPQIAWTVDSVTPSKDVGVLDITIVEADTLAKLASDTTAAIYIGEAKWFMDPTAEVLHLPVRVTNHNAAGDSITIDVDAGARINATTFVWDATEAMNALGPINGQGTNVGELVEWGKYIRVRILAADSTGLNSGYTVVLSVPAVR